jgi:hypothetical protein
MTDVEQIVVRWKWFLRFRSRLTVSISITRDISLGTWICNPFQHMYVFRPMLKFYFCHPHPPALKKTLRGVEETGGNVQLLYSTYTGTFTMFFPLFGLFHLLKAHWSKCSLEQMNKGRGRLSPITKTTLLWNKVECYTSFRFLLTGLVESLCQVSFYDVYSFTQLVICLLMFCHCCHVYDVGLW